MFGKSFPPEEPTIQRAVNPTPTRRSHASRSSVRLFDLVCSMRSHAPTFPFARMKSHVMNSRVLFTVTLLLAMAWVAPAWGRMVRIETTAPLADQSDETLWRATQRAIESAVQRAKTLRLRSYWIDDAWVLEDAVVLWMIATDDDPEDDPKDDDDGLVAGVRPVL